MFREASVAARTQMIQQLGAGYRGYKEPSYGYHVNPLKSVLLVKPAFYHQATELFSDTGVSICTNGVQYLGAAIGTYEITKSFLEHKVLRWREEVENLRNFAESQPQAAYTAYTLGLKNKWSFLCRAMPDAATALAPVEQILTDKLIPTITGRLVNTEERTILALPCRYGGLGLINPTELSTQYRSSQQITQALQTNIKWQECAIGMPSRMCAQLRRK